MKLHLKTRRILPWALVVLSVASTINLVIGARDYLLLYASLGQVQFTVSRMILQGTVANETSIQIQVRADNPVDYAGLRPTLVNIVTYFASGNSSLFEHSPVERSWMINQTLAPHAVTMWTLSVELNPQNATSVSNFYDAHNGMDVARTVLLVTVSSFLDIVTGSPSFYQENQNITLTKST
jgi:hypothetical protein